MLPWLPTPVAVLRPRASAYRCHRAATGLFRFPVDDPADTCSGFPVPKLQSSPVPVLRPSVVSNYEKANYIWLNKVFHTPQQHIYSKNVNQVELWVQRRYDCVEPSGEQSSSESPYTLQF